LVGPSQTALDDAGLARLADFHQQQFVPPIAFEQVVRQPAAHLSSGPKDCNFRHENSDEIE
jgi:hypothetical protein